MNALPCPPLNALLVPDEELSPETREHLTRCRRCRTLRPRLLARAPRQEIVGDASALTKEPTPRAAGADAPSLGAVYALHGPLVDEYLVGALVDWDDEEAVVVPISDAVIYATNWDLLVEGAGLGYDAIAEVWNHGTVLVEQLEEKLGELGQLTDALTSLFQAALESGQVPTGVPVGPAIVDDADPRLLFQDEEGERAAVYWQPAILLAGVASLGELVQVQRGELMLEPQALADVVAEADLAALERDRLDIGSRFEAPAFALLMKRLGLDATRRLEALVRQAFVANYRDPLEGAAGLAFRRTRRGAGRRVSGIDDKERLAHQWASAVIEEMRR